MNPIIYYTIQFILGGASVVGISLISKYINPKYAGILYALPVILIIATISIYLDQGLEISRKTLKSTFIYEFTLLYFILAFYFLSLKMNFWLSIGLAFLSWALIAIIIQFWLF